MFSDINQLTELVIGSAIEVHKQLDPGLLESTYRDCLCYEFSLRKIPFEKEKTLPVNYKGIHLDCGYRIDLVADNQLVLELKTIEAILPIHKA
jgi:GxxExxY protein